MTIFYGRHMISKRNNRFLQIAIIITLIAVPVSLTSAAKDYIEKNGDPNDPGMSVITDYKIDMDGDGKQELVRINYGEGVSDKFLTIEVYKANKLIDTIKGEFGIQSNYKIDDIDKDGKKEIIIWSGIWDPRMPGEDGVTESIYEGHSAPHRYVVATYKLIRGRYQLWDVYTTKKKYEPFCEEQPM